MKKVLLLLILWSAMVFTGHIFIRHVQAQDAPVPALAGANICSIVGNNFAITFNGKGNYNEASFTLASLAGRENVEPIIKAINGTDKTMIIRLGPAKGFPGPADPNEYADMLLEIAQAVGGKPFTAMASHNEPNCAELAPLADEVAYATIVADRIKQSTAANQITVITGQIDTYCDPVPGEPTIEYIAALTNIPGIEGLSLPFYITNVTTPSPLERLKAAMALTSLPIYITESGPYKPGSMPEFAAAVPQVVALPNVKAFLLFNALRLNPDPEFNYTRPFWSLACRRALRTQCQDVEAVIKACGEQEPDDYYLYPIQGLAEGNSGQILTDLIDQGYQMHCTTPRITAEAMQGDQIARLMELAEQNASYVGNYNGVKSIQSFDYVQSQIPLLRDTSLVSSLYNSLEDFFGFQSFNKDPENVQSNVESAPLITMLALQDQCAQKVKILESIEKLCSKLEDPSTCGLYQPIPGAEKYTTQDLLTAYRQEGDAVRCENVFGGKDESLVANLTPQQQEISNAIQRTPLYLDRAYRLAFLVIVSELLEEKPNSFFNFLRSDGTSQPNHSVKVLAFKIPDFATNRKIEASAYTDPLQLTRNLLGSESQNDANQEKIVAEREELRTAAASQTINCSTADCTDPMTRSLVELVNKSPFQSCDADPDALKYEPVNQIFSSGELISSAGTQFADGSDPAKKLFNVTPLPVPASTPAPPLPTSDEDNNSPQIAVFNFLSNIKLGLRGGESKAKIKSYLVMPVGAELETAEDSIMALFNHDWIENYESDPNFKKYYKITGISQDMVGGKVSHTFFDPTLTTVCNPTVVNFPECLEKKASLEVVAPQNDHAPRLPFGRLGYIARKVQDVGYQIATPARDFLASITTTEEWLLQNQVLKQPGGSGENPLPVPIACQGYSSQTIQIPTQPELITKIYQYANQNGITPQLLWGVFQIESGPFLRAMRAGKTTMSCGETINSCGATGPLQIIQGVCVTDQCKSPLIQDLKRIVRPDNICSVDGSLAWAAQALKSYENYPEVQAALARIGADQKDYLLAAKYLGLNVDKFDLPQCKSSQGNSASPISGCNGLNYCQCAVDSFDLPPAP